MAVRRFVCLVGAVVILTAHSSARQGPPEQGRGKATHVVVAADRHDVSPALRSMPLLPPKAGPKREIERQDRPTHVGPKSRRFVPDPVAQSYPGPAAPPASGTSFDGIPNVDGALPPDTNGDVGPNHFVQWVNLSFAIFSKGSATTPPALIYGPAAGNTLWQGFGGPCELTNDGDPVVRYDHLADRWVMSQLSIPNAFLNVIAGPFYQCIAVSATSDPTGAYYRYQFTFDKLNDYPKLGVWPDAYYMTMNQYTSVSLQYAGQGVVAFDREHMLAGLPASMVYFDLGPVDMNLGGMLPADLDGPPPPAGAPGYFAQVDDDAWGYAPDQLQLWKFHVDWVDSSASTFTGPAAVPTAEFDSNLCGYARSCIPQPGTSAGLDAVSDRLMYRLQYRNFGDHESLVVNHTVDVDGSDHAGIRWYEVRDPGTTPVIFQQGTYAPDTDNRWMASAAMDGAGNLALGFSVSGQGTAPSIRYTGRLATDPPGILGQGEAELVAGGGSQLAPEGRWGDYSMLVVDPMDDCTFWYTQEYYADTSDNGWRTRIGTFAFPTCSSTSSVPVISVAATTPSASEAGPTSGTFTVTRTGDLSAPLSVTYDVGGTATPGSDYIPLSGLAIFSAGQATATISVDPIDDLLVESAESVSVTLTTTGAYRLGVPSEAFVSITSDDAPPDLIVSGLSVPATSGAGETITITDTTVNQSASPSPSSLTGFYLSANSLLDSGDTLLGSRPVPDLAAGGLDSRSSSFTVPSNLTSGTYYLFAKADYDNAVPETTETNNTKAATIRIGPDLTVSTVTVPSFVAAGTSISVSDTTVNSGGGTAGASITAFYLSTDVALGTNDPRLGSRSVSDLAPGASSSGSTSVTIPTSTAAGTYYLIAKADDAGVIGEAQETNNLKFGGPIHVGPDLVMTGVSASISATGDSVTVNETTKNQGAGGAAPSTTGFYLSTNTVLDSADSRLGGRAVPGLATGASSTASTTVGIPAGLSSGQYYLLVKADADDQVAESLETNNVAVVIIRLGPDLIVSASTVPGAVGAGDAVPVSDTTKNQGTGGAGASTTSFYLSVNTALDASDVLIGSRPVPALAGGATSSASTTVVIPEGTATGTYYVLAVADANNQVPETLETNNVLAKLTLLGPDLSVSTLTASNSVKAGATISVSDKTSNLGAGAAPGSTTAYYFSSNVTLDASDLRLGSRPVAALGPAAGDTGSINVTIPAGTPTGTYYIIAVADDPNAIVETKENDNTRVKLISVK